MISYSYNPQTLSSCYLSIAFMSFLSLLLFLGGAFSTSFTDDAPCDGDGWRPLLNLSFPIDYAPADDQKLPVPFPSCTNYIRWSVPDGENFSKNFEDSMLCPIVPFERLRQHKFAVDCSSWDRGDGLAIDNSTYHADVMRFASLLFKCEENEPSVYNRFLVTNLCSTIDQRLTGSLISGCLNSAPDSKYRMGNAMLTQVKFIKSDPSTYSCVPPSVNHSRLTVIAWTGVESTETSPAGSLPDQHCVWRQQGMPPLSPEEASLEVTWQHGSPQSAFQNSAVCNLTRPLLVVASDQWAHWGGNTWHTWHNVVYMTFSALYDSGLLTCDEITGSCSTTQALDFLLLYRPPPTVIEPNPSMCAFLQRMFGQQDMGCTTDPNQLHNTCYERVLVQAAATSNALIYGADRRTNLRLFARAIEFLHGLPPLKPAEVEDRPPFVVFLDRPVKRRGFNAISFNNLHAIMKKSGIPFMKLACSTKYKKRDMSVIRKATVLIGATGAAFTNTWHLTKGAVAVLASTGSPWYETWYFKALVLSTGSTYIRWTPAQQNYSDPTFSSRTPFPSQDQSTWRTVLRTALLQQDEQARSHPKVVAFLKQTESNPDPTPQDRRCRALLMVYKPHMA